MRITFDTSVDALSVVLSDAEVTRTLDVGDGRFVDVDQHGEIVAIEIHSAGQGFQLADLAEKFDLEPLFVELSDQIRQVREGMRRDPRLREVLSSR